MTKQVDPKDARAIEARLKAQAAQIGFADCAIARADSAPLAAARLRQWLDEIGRAHV
jgi:epoxyqueuosine reductase